ncbi:MAG: hypothetical protein ACJAZI_000674 [Cycloclasticus sp.]
MGEKPNVQNYCACFIDLLGQRNALAGQSIIPNFASEQEKADFLKIVNDTVGAIEQLQVRAQDFIQGKADAYSIRKYLSSEEQELYDEMGKVGAKQQRWSDGLVYYSSLNNEMAKCPMRAVLQIFMLSGTFCFLGLANKHPIRGAIETAWGVELHENELYGAIVANSYDLESKVAQYPRIVVGDKTMNYLDVHLELPPNNIDKLALYNRDCAVLCKDMTTIDQDGYHIVDYLGTTFTKSVTSSTNQELFGLAYRYIDEQYSLHRNNKDTKLALRYAWLREYFHKNKHLHS